MIETTPHPTGSPPDGREDPVRDRGEAFAPWLLNAPFVLLHLAAVAVFFVPVSWGAVLLCANNYFWRMFGITAVYHRYFSHRSYKTSRVFQFLLAWLACSSLQRGPLWWAGHHRIHHLHSDTPQDPHSPYETSFWWAHVGWILSEEHAATTEEIKHEYARYPELAWLDRYHWLPGIVLALACFLAGAGPTSSGASSSARSCSITAHSPSTPSATCSVRGDTRPRTTVATTGCWP